MPDASDSLRMLVTECCKDFVEKFSWYRIKHGNLGDSLKDNLFKKLFRNWCKGENWGTRKCDLTVAFFLLCHTRKAAPNGEDFVFEKVTQDAWKVVENHKQKEEGVCLFCLIE